MTNRHVLHLIFDYVFDTIGTRRILKLSFLSSTYFVVGGHNELYYRVHCGTLAVDYNLQWFQYLQH